MNRWLQKWITRFGLDALPALRRFLIGAIGFSVVLIGLVMIVLPGPAFIVVAVCVAILARELALALAQRFRKVYADAHCELDFKNPLQLLVATILSVQCSDKRVNMVTPALFKKYRDAQAFAHAKPATFEGEIRSTGFFRSKTKSILGACQA